jgi:hypothetical protein
MVGVLVGDHERVEVRGATCSWSRAKVPLPQSIQIAVSP